MCYEVTIPMGVMLILNDCNGRKFYFPNRKNHNDRSLLPTFMVVTCSHHSVMS
jgi:hypothetical protein